MWLFMEICQRLRISNEIRIITTFQWGFKNIEINGLFMLISIRIMLLVLLFFLSLSRFVMLVLVRLQPEKQQKNPSFIFVYWFGFWTFTKMTITDIGYWISISIFMEIKSHQSSHHWESHAQKKFMLIDIVNITFPHFCHFISITSNSAVSLGSVSLLGRKRGKKHKIKSAAKSLCAPHVNHHTIVNICSIKHHTKRKSTRCDRHERREKRERETEANIWHKFRWNK